MATQLKRFSLTLRPDWEEELTALKKEYFYNKSFSELMRYIVDIGLPSARKTLEEKDEPVKHSDA